MFDIRRSQAQRITFTMVDDAGVEVSGINGALSVAVSKNGAPFTTGAGQRGEIGSGWYYYDLTASETDTYGPLSIAVTGGSSLQQNLEYVVVDRSLNTLEYTYTVINSVTGLPLPQTAILVTTDSLGLNHVWVGTTDVFGVARDANGNLPRFNPGTYYFWRTRVGFAFADPDQEVIG